VFRLIVNSRNGGSKVRRRGGGGGNGIRGGGGEGAKNGIAFLRRKLFKTKNI